MPDHLLASVAGVDTQCCGVFDIGDAVYLRAECYNSAGELDDPTVLVARTRTPAGVETAYTFGVDANLTRQTGEAVGKFQCRVLATEASTHEANWCWRWKATGDVVAAEEGHFRVRASQFSSP